MRGYRPSYSSRKTAKAAMRAAIRARFSTPPIVIQMPEFLHEVEASGPGVIPLPAPGPLDFVMAAARMLHAEVVSAAPGTPAPSFAGTARCPICDAGPLDCDCGKGPEHFL